MTQFARPLLAEFASPAEKGSALQLLECDATTGLLRRYGADRPVIEELLELEAASRDHLRLGTSSRGAITTCLDTLATDYKKVIPDPDVVRSEMTNRDSITAWLGSLITNVKKGPPRPDDPDFVRSELMALTETSRTFGKLDQPDPEGMRDFGRNWAERGADAPPLESGKQ